MKRLLIMRHATPAEAGHDGTDHTRPLNELGHREAYIQGSFLREAGVIPHLVLSSSAYRARETSEVIVDALDLGRAPDYGGVLTVRDDLYNAPGTMLLSILQLTPDPVDTLLVVAHMPGVAELLSHLTVDSGEMATAFQPGTLVAVSMPDAPNWAEVGYGSGMMEWCIPPLLLHYP